MTDTDLPKPQIHEGTEWTNKPPTPNLNRALLTAQMAVPADVPKDGQTSFGDKYRYTTAETMVQVCRTALHSAGLCWRPIGWHVTIMDLPWIVATGETLKSQYGEKQVTRMDMKPTAILHRSCELVHAESGESVRYEWVYPIVTEKGRPPDKALSGALTVSQAYFLRDLLQVARGLSVSDDIDQRDDREDKATATHRETPAPAGTGRGPESQIPEVAKTSSITPKITLMSLVGTWVAKHNNSPEPKGEALVAYTRGVLDAIGCQRDGTGRMMVDDAAMLRAIDWCKPRMDKGEAPPTAVG